MRVKTGFCTWESRSVELFFCLQDSDRDWSGHPPDVLGRAGLSEQRRVTRWIKLEHDGICSSQKEAGVIFVCCTFTPTVSFNNKKKSFWSKITTVPDISLLWSFYFICICAQCREILACHTGFICQKNSAAEGNVYGNLSVCRALPLSFLLWLSVL